MSGASRRTACLGLAGTLAAACQNKPPRLSLELRSQKPSFRLGEPVEIEGRLTNVSREPLLVNRRFLFPGPEVYLQLRDQESREIGWLSPEPPPPLSARDFVMLAPGETLAFRLPDLRSWVQKGLPVGTYSARATYHNVSAPQVGWKTSADKVESPVIEIRVVR